MASVPELKKSFFAEIDKVNSLFHGARSECFVNGPPHQKFKRDVRNEKVEALLPEAVQLLGYDKIKKSSTCSKTLASLQKPPKNLPRSLRFGP